MGPNSNQLQLQLQLRVRLATVAATATVATPTLVINAVNTYFCGYNKGEEHNNNNNRRSQPAVCWQAILWRSQSLSPASTLFCLPRASLLFLIPPALPLLLVTVVIPVLPCTFCNQMRLTPTIVFGFSCCNIAAFYRCGKLTNWQPATSNCKLETGNWQVQL